MLTYIRCLNLLPLWVSDQPHVGYGGLAKTK